MLATCFLEAKETLRVHLQMAKINRTTKSKSGGGCAGEGKPHAQGEESLMRRGGKPHPLLVGSQTSRASLQTRMENPKAKDRPTI